MLPHVTLADVPAVPFLIGGGLLLVVIAGVFITLAVGVFGYIKRRKNQSSLEEEQNLDRTEHGS